MNRQLAFFFLGGLIFAACSNQPSSGISFEMSQLPYASGPVWIKINDEISPDSKLVFKSENRTIPLQRWDDSTWVFIKDETTTNLSAFQLQEAENLIPRNVQITEEASGITVKVNNRPVLTFNTGTMQPPEGQPAYYQRSGFIHPLYSPARQILTDDFPVGHAHQHGLFMAWVNTTFKGEKVDFWNQQHELGTVRLLEVTDTLSGPVYAQFKAKLEHISLKDGPALHEDWTITVYHTENDFLLDFESIQKTASTDTLFLNQYHYGGFGFRATKEWNPADSVHFTNAMQIITSLGDERDSSNHTRPEWIAGYGQIEQQVAGLMVMGQLDNYRYPQHVRVHPEMPYFCFPPMVEEGFSMAPGDVYTSNYRLLVFSGAPNLEKMESVWSDYRGSQD